MSGVRGATRARVVCAQYLIPSPQVHRAEPSSKKAPAVPMQETTGVRTLESFDERTVRRHRVSQAQLPMQPCRPTLPGAVAPLCNRRRQAQAQNNLQHARRQLLAISFPTLLIGGATALADSPQAPAATPPRAAAAPLMNLPTTANAGWYLPRLTSEMAFDTGFPMPSARKTLVTSCRPAKSNPSMHANQHWKEDKPVGSR